MRKPKPKFSDESHYMRDVQVVIDENYVNYMLFQLFYQKKTYSLTEFIIQYMPEDFLGGGAILRALMSTQVWQVFFPELTKDYGEARIDLRCGWSKDFLKKGELSESSISQIQFRDDNMIDLNLHFGCGVHVYDSGDKKEPVQALMELFTSITPDEDDSKWKEHSSFFMSLQGEMDFDFSDGAKVFKPNFSLEGLTGTDMFDALTDPINKDVNIAEGVPMIFGILKDFRPVIKELKVFDKRGKARVDQADELNDKIMDLKKLTKKQPVLKMVTEKVFGQGFPMVPFPDVERCFGLHAKDSTMQIQDGFAIMAFDYDVRSSKENCIFNIKDSLSKKELRMAKKNKNTKGFDLGDATRKLKKMVEINAKNLKPPPLPDFDIKNLDFNDMAEMM
jgi:hypothetical protein